MKIKKGDTVQMRSGKDRGKQGKVIQVMPGVRKVVVEGLNTFVKHLRPQGSGQKGQQEKGQRIELSRAVPESTVAFVCPKCNKLARLGHTVLKDGTKTRTCKKCNETVD